MPMKSLFLLRHAKSDWGEPRRADHDRPLNPRGQRAARLLGDHLAHLGFRPDLVLCSSARRTRETLEGLRPGLAGTPRVEIDRALYLAEAMGLLELLAGLDDAVNEVLVIGHNPGIAELAVGLAGDGDAATLAELRRKYPTAALTQLRLAGETWADVGLGCGRLLAFTTPKGLEAAAQ